MQKLINTDIPHTYEQLIHEIESMSFAKVTNNIGDYVNPNRVKKMIVAMTSLLEFYLLRGKRGEK